MRVAVKGLEIVPGTAFGDLRRLEPLALRVFGVGDRPRGWFARKLLREAVNPALSTVAIVDGEPYGYVLVGGSRSGLARTAGVGVDPLRRGRGIGTRLLREAARAAQTHGSTRLLTLADPARVGFYAREGFVHSRTNHSLLNFSCGDAERLDPPRDWDDRGTCTHEHAAWMQLAWAGTPAAERASVAFDDEATVLVSREGSAYLVHRLTTKSADDEAVVRIASRLLQRLPMPRPLLLYGCNAVSSVTSSLVRAGWVPVQTAVVMEKPLHG